MDNPEDIVVSSDEISHKEDDDLDPSRHLLEARIKRAAKERGPNLVVSDLKENARSTVALTRENVFDRSDLEKKGVENEDRPYLLYLGDVIRRGTLVDVPKDAREVLEKLRLKSLRGIDRLIEEKFGWKAFIAKANSFLTNKIKDELNSRLSRAEEISTSYVSESLLLALLKKAKPLEIRTLFQLLGDQKGLGEIICLLKEISDKETIGKINRAIQIHREKYPSLNPSFLRSQDFSRFVGYNDYPNPLLSITNRSEKFHGVALGPTFLSGGQMVDIGSKIPRSGSPSDFLDRYTVLLGALGEHGIQELSSEVQRALNDNGMARFIEKVARFVETNRFRQEFGIVNDIKDLDKDEAPLISLTRIMNETLNGARVLSSDLSDLLNELPVDVNNVDVEFLRMICDLNGQLRIYAERDNNFSNIISRMLSGSVNPDELNDVYSEWKELQKEFKSRGHKGRTELERLIKAADFKHDSDREFLSRHGGARNAIGQIVRTSGLAPVIYALEQYCEYYDLCFEYLFTWGMYDLELNKFIPTAFNNRPDKLSKRVLYKMRDRIEEFLGTQSAAALLRTVAVLDSGQNLSSLRDPFGQTLVPLANYRNNLVLSDRIANLSVRGYKSHGLSLPSSTTSVTSVAVINTSDKTSSGPVTPSLGSKIPLNNDASRFQRTATPTVPRPNLMEFLVGEDVTDLIGASRQRKLVNEANPSTATTSEMPLDEVRRRLGKEKNE